MTEIKPKYQLGQKLYEVIGCKDRVREIEIAKIEIEQIDSEIDYTYYAHDGYDGYNWVEEDDLFENPEDAEKEIEKRKLDRERRRRKDYAESDRELHKVIDYDEYHALKKKSYDFHITVAGIRLRDLIIGHDLEVALMLVHEGKAKIEIAPEKDEN